MISELKSRPLTLRVLAYGVAAQVAIAILHVLNKPLFGDGAFLALDSDSGISAWATVVLFAGGALTCGLLAAVDRGLLVPFGTLACICALLSLGQISQAHYFFENDLGDPAASLIQAAVGLALLASLLACSRRLAPPHRELLGLAIVCVALAALASKANSSLDLPYLGIVALQALEETAETIAATLVIAATLEPMLIRAARLAGALSSRLAGAREVSEPRPTRERAAATPPPAR